MHHIGIIFENKLNVIGRGTILVTNDNHVNIGDTINYEDEIYEVTDIESSIITSKKQLVGLLVKKLN